MTLDFVHYDSVIDSFKPMVREQTFDVAELPIVSYLVAREFGKPMTLLPVR
ncbi:hypothetical protein H8B02_30505 [Bradyrhizobium sp. Pear77]|uniref:hypothetical protein n=1 Tax=Bradyrhizobium TaxID=374 RepID=UPI001E3B022A|nr:MULTISPECIES: hypothetical protein [Bradyrhizobium]MCC8957608.1 hypothetical protein [Bradyrhizobium altum]MCC8968472.1 hypothetical protein [Bradyrhizobium oropedii]